MRAYQVTRPSNGTNFFTSDFNDIWNVLDEGNTGDPIQVTVFEIPVAEFYEKIKQNINGPELPGQIAITD